MKRVCRSPTSFLSNSLPLQCPRGLFSEKLRGGVWPASQNPYPTYDQICDIPYPIYRVCTGPGKPGKSWNFIMAFSRTGKSWKKATGPGKFWKSVKLI